MLLKRSGATHSVLPSSAEYIVRQGIQQIILPIREHWCSTLLRYTRIDCDLGTSV
ncbi:MAG: hypothetical protein AAGA75_14315 [Cyanobacteria bacterium P01_E01_bin.6]